MKERLVFSLFFFFAFPAIYFYQYGLLDIFLYFGTMLLYFCSQILPALFWELLQLGSHIFLTCFILLVFLSTTACFILYFPCPSFRSSHFVKEPWFFLLENVLEFKIWAHWACSLLLGRNFKNVLKFFFFLAVLGLSCHMWHIVPRLGIEPRPPALDAQGLNHWTTKKVPRNIYILKLWLF